MKIFHIMPLYACFFFFKYKTFLKSICLYFPEIEKCNIYQHGNYILEVRDELKDSI